MREDWFRIMAEAKNAGAHHIQFIGGEPMLVPWLPEAFREATRLGFEVIEVFTNGTRLNETLLETIVSCDVHVAVSLYSHEPTVHDAISCLPGSHKRTLAAIRRLQERQVSLRVGIVRVPINADAIDETLAFVSALGITNIGIDDARAFGRAQAIVGRTPSVDELCGNCWRGTLCVGPDGAVTPCIMSRGFVVGNAAREPLASILSSETLQGAREEIRYAHPTSDSGENAVCDPSCIPDKCVPTDCLPCKCIPTNCIPGRGKATDTEGSRLDVIEIESGNLQRVAELALETPSVPAEAK